MPPALPSCTGAASAAGQMQAGERSFGRGCFGQAAKSPWPLAPALRPGFATWRMRELRSPAGPRFIVQGRLLPAAPRRAAGDLLRRCRGVSALGAVARVCYFGPLPARASARHARCDQICGGKPHASDSAAARPRPRPRPAEIRRLLTHSSNPSAWLEECRIFYEHLRNRGYPAGAIDFCFRSFNSLQRNNMLI